MSDDVIRIGAPLRDAANPHPEDTTVRIGTPLRDAAVDPQPGDDSVPTNAGRADPHGPLVVAPQALTREEQAAARAAAAEAGQ